MNRYILLTLFGWIGFVGSLAAQVSFEARADARQVVLNGYFDLSFTLKNADGSDFRPPNFNGFTVASGPGRSVSTTIVNGQVSKEMSFNYVLQPKSTGKYIIGSASIVVGGKRLTSEPIQIEVVEGRNGGAGDEEVYIKAEPNTTEAWVGQQVVLDYKLYTTVNIDSYNIIEESDYPGFYARDIKRYDSRVTREVIDGVQYVTKVLRRVALFPQQAGALTIEPLNIQLGITSEGQRSGLFFNRQVRRVPAQTEPVVINVRSLPANAPESFTGAVGKFKFETYFNRSTMTTDDALSVRFSLSGDGDIKRVSPPRIAVPDHFEEYDPTVKEDGMRELNGGLTGKKVVEYLFVPTKAEVVRIQPEFTYFDPDSARYITLKEEVHQLAIRQGSQQKKPIVDQSKEEASTAELRYIKLDTKLQKKNRYFAGSTFFWILSILPLLMLGGVVVLKQIQNRQNNLDPLLLKSRKARKAALLRLATAEKHMQSKDSRAFYDEVSKAMLGYVCDKLQIPLSELTKDNVKEKLESLEVEGTSIESFLKIINTSEMALFAGMDNTESMNQTYQDALDVLSTIETNLSS